MDFVVVGLGLGALGVLVGLALRDLAPRPWRVRAATHRPPAEVARRVAQARALRVGGRVLALAGGALWLATLAALAAGLDDRAGALVVLIVATLLLVAISAWVAAYAHRYHPRPARRPARTTTPAAGPPPLAAAITAETPAWPTADDPASPILPDPMPAPEPLAAHAAPFAEPPPTIEIDHDAPTLASQPLPAEAAPTGAHRPDAPAATAAPTDTTIADHRLPSLDPADAPDRHPVGDPVIAGLLPMGKAS